MLPRQAIFDGDDDEAELLQHMCSLVARDRNYRMASIAAVQPGEITRTVCQSGGARDFRDEAVQQALRTGEAVAIGTTAVVPFTVDDAPLLCMAESNKPDACTGLELAVLK